LHKQNDILIIYQIITNTYWFFAL